MFASALGKYRRDGLVPLVRSAVPYVLSSTRSAVAAKVAGAFSWYLCRNSVSAETVARDTVTYTGDATIDVGVDGGTPRSELADASGTWESSPRAVHVLSDARTVGRCSLLFSSNGELVCESVSGSGYLLRLSIKDMLLEDGYATTVRRLFEATTGSIEDRRDSDATYSMVMTNTHANNYYHWVVEHLPRLRAIEDGLGLHPTDVDVLVRDDAPTFVSSYLDRFGYATRTTSTGDATVLDTALVPDHTFRSRNHEFSIAPGDVHWVRQRVTEGLDVDDGEFPKRIFVSREDTSNRRIRNRDAFERVLSEFDFETYELAELSVDDQIRMFSRAEVILGAHGAGLANQIFATDATVVELYGESLTQGIFFLVLANELGHDYYSLLCPDDGRDIVVPVDALRRLLETGVR